MKKHVLLILLFLTSFMLRSQTFELLNTPTTGDLWDVYFFDENHGFIAGDVFLRTDDGGITWESYSTPISDIYQIEFFDNLNGILVGALDIYTTSDGGESWTYIWGVNDNFIDLEIINDSTCILSGYFTGLRKSTDRGHTWEVLVEDNPNQMFGMLSFVNDSVGYNCKFGRNDLSRTYKTTDGGLSWDTIICQDTSDIEYIVEELHFVSEEVGYRGGWNGIWKTVDGGNTWPLADYADTSNFWPFIEKVTDFHIESDETNYFACGGYGQTYRSTDEGDHWEVYQTMVFPYHDFEGIYMLNDSIGWAVSEYGILVKINFNAEPSGIQVSETVTACNSYSIGGQVFTQTGLYQVELAGDTTLLLDLYISSGVEAAVSEMDNVLMADNWGDYQWYNCSNWTLIDGATFGTFEPTETGSYALVLTYEECADTSACFEILVTSIENPSSKDKWELFPNPGNDNFTLKVNQTDQEGIFISIFDLTGKLALEKNLSLGDAWTINTQNLHKGMYIIKIERNERVEYLRWVKN